MNRALASLIAVVATLALPGAAGAAITPQKSIAGVQLGMSEAQVVALHGTPSRTVRGSNDFGPYTELVYRAKRLRVLLQGTEEVTDVSTTSTRERTRRGVRVGSSERSVRRNVPRVRCETFERTRLCTVGSFEPGRTVTTFFIRRGEVSRISLGIVID